GGVLAAKQATTTVPIVMESLATDPVATGLVESLARPGGNITGFTIMTIEMAGKRLELFKAAVPTLGRGAVLYDAGNPGNVLHAHAVQTAGAGLGGAGGVWGGAGGEGVGR